MGIADKMTHEQAVVTAMRIQKIVEEFGFTPSELAEYLGMWAAGVLAWNDAPVDVFQKFFDEITDAKEEGNLAPNKAESKRGMN